MFEHCVVLLWCVCVSYWVSVEINLHERGLLGNRVSFFAIDGLCVCVIRFIFLSSLSMSSRSGLSLSVFPTPFFSFTLSAQQKKRYTSTCMIMTYEERVIDQSDRELELFVKLS